MNLQGSNLMELDRLIAGPGHQVARAHKNTDMSNIDEAKKKQMELKLLQLQQQQNLRLTNLNGGPDSSATITENESPRKDYGFFSSRALDVETTDKIEFLGQGQG